MKEDHGAEDHAGDPEAEKNLVFHPSPFCRSLTGEKHEELSICRTIRQMSELYNEEKESSKRNEAGDEALFQFLIIRACGLRFSFSRIETASGRSFFD